MSFIITGLGQLYNGDVVKDIILFVAQIAVSIVLWGLLGRIGAIINLVIWIYGIYDTYTKAQAINSGTYQLPTQTY